MGEKKEYDPGVYRRLELVQKQFKNDSAQQKRTRAAERRRAIWDDLRQNRIQIGRIALYTLLGLLLAAVILVVVFDKA
jgi:hypothetical protein